MKKVIFVLLAAVLCTCLFGCSKQAENNDNTDKETQDEMQSDKIAINEDIIKSLMKENDFCNAYVFGASNLEPTGIALKDNIYPVETSKFSDFNAFKEYLLGVYKKEYVEYLLSDYPDEGQPLYLNVDGKLCINMDLASAKGYFVDWSQPMIKIVGADYDECVFVATGKLTHPGDEPVEEDYIIEGRAVFENGRWVLEKMLY